MFRHAIVRMPGSNFDAGLTTVSLGRPVIETVLEQHARYCAALEQCGLTLTVLEADLRYPDSTFVEDTAVISERGAILTRPGATSRLGEVESICPALKRFFPAMPVIEAPGTVDGGDICEAGEHFFLGLSHRTNEEGAHKREQLFSPARPRKEKLLAHPLLLNSLCRSEKWRWNLQRLGLHPEWRTAPVEVSSTKKFATHS